MSIVDIRFPGNLGRFDGKFSYESSQTWGQLLREILGEQIIYLLDAENKPTTYVAFYLNGDKQDDVATMACCEQDKLVILSAVSGG